MSDSKVEIKVPDDLIRATIMAEVAKSLPNRDKMIEEMVKQILGAKQNSYDKETEFEKVTRDLIKDQAKGIMKEWLEENKPRIRAALLKEMNRTR